MRTNVRNSRDISYCITNSNFIFTCFKVKHLCLIRNSKLTFFLTNWTLELSTFLFQSCFCKFHFRFIHNNKFLKVTLQM